MPTGSIATSMATDRRFNRQGSLPFCHQGCIMAENLLAKKKLIYEFY